MITALMTLQKKQFEKILIDFRYSPIAEIVKSIGTLGKPNRNE